MSQSPDQKPGRKVFDEATLQQEMLDVRRQIAERQAVSRQLAPRWDPRTIRPGRPPRML